MGSFPVAEHTKNHIETTAVSAMMSVTKILPVFFKPFLSLIFPLRKPPKTLRV